MSKRWMYSIVGLCVAITVGAVSSAVIVYGRYTRSQELIRNPELVIKEEIDALVTAIGAFMELPSDETPQLATVSDVEQLKGQAFFAAAQNGDKVLIYSKALKAILYRPSTTKVIEVSVYQPPQGSNVPNTSATPASTPIRIALRNGTTSTTVTGAFEKLVTARVPDARIVLKDLAKDRTYAYTMVIDLTGTKKAQAAQLAQILDVAVGELPKKEATPSGDFLIILGKDASEKTKSDR